MRAIHPHPDLRLRALILCLLLVTAAGGCNCNGGNGTLDPSEVTPSDLYGWWTHTDAQSGTVTVFGFVPRAEATRVLPLAPEEVTGDVSAVYQGAKGFLTEPVQLATFEVKDGELLQTVIRDANAPPGTQYRTRIVSLQAQGTLELQSTQSSAGSRSYSFSPRCPEARANGAFDVPGQVCNSYFSGATSLAVDARGHVHAASAIIGAAGASCAPGRFPTPTYSHFADACGPALTPLPNFRASTLLVDESSVHFAYMSLSAYDITQDYLLFYRYRPLDLSGNWVEEPVAPQGNPVHEMRLLMRERQPLLVVSRTDGTIDVYRRDAGAWTRVPTLLVNGTPLTGRMADAALDREGRLVLLLESSHQLAYERAGGFELLPLPKEGMAAGFGGGVTVDASGRVHIVYNYDEIGDNASGVGGRVVNGRGLYALYDGAQWTQYELGPMAYPRLVTRAEGPWRVVHALAKAAKPTLALTELSPDGSLRSELLSLEPSFGAGNSPEPYYHPTAAMGPDGTVAAAWDGNRVYIRPPEAQLVRERTTLTLQVEGRGRGRVRSGDGTINCTATCTVEVPVGARYQLFFEPEAGSAREQVTCAPGYFALDGYCWVDVFPGQSPPTVMAKFRETPVLSLLPVAAADGSSLVKRLAARGGRVAIAATTSNGKLPMGDSVVDVGAAQDALAVRESDGRVWGVGLPMTPEALGFRSDGRVSALFLANRELSFPSGPVGSNTAPVLVLAHYANGSFQGVERLVELPRGTSMAAGAAAVGDDDAVGAVVSNFSAFGSLGVSDYTLFVYRNPAGTLVLRGLSETGSVTGSGQVSLAAGRAAVTLNSDFLLLFEGGAQVATRTMVNGRIQAVTHAGDKVLSVWGLTQPFSSRYVEYGPDGSARSSLDLTAGQNAAYLAPAPSGPVFSGPAQRSGLMHGRLTDPDYFFFYGGDFAGNKSAPLLADNDLEANSQWVVVHHEGTVDYDVATLQVPYRQVLVQFRLR
jgi:hypothetical protein